MTQWTKSRTSLRRWISNGLCASTSSVCAIRARPGILTVDSTAAMVVQDVAAYQELLDRLDRAEAIVGINCGLVSMRRGEGKPAEVALAGLRRQLGVGL